MKKMNKHQNTLLSKLAAILKPEMTFSSLIASAYQQERQ